MILAQLPYQGKTLPVRVVERYTRPDRHVSALIETRDGSKPFTAFVARSDPEETLLHDTARVNWLWVDGNDLTAVYCTHERVALVARGGWHFSPDGPWDDIEEYLYCLDCNEEVTRVPSTQAVEGVELPF